MKRLLRFVLLALLVTAAVPATGMALFRLPAPPEQPASGPGGMQASWQAVAAVRVGVPPAGYWLFTPADPKPEATPGAEARPLPLVIFLHGFTAVDPVAYRAWIDHIVRRGAVVVYPDYQTNDPFGTPWDEMLPNAIDAVRDATADLRHGDYPPTELDRAAFVGHSLGGVLAVGLAAVAADAGLPDPVAVMPVQPAGCRGCGLPIAGGGVPLPSLAGVPTTSRLLMVVSADDRIAGDRTARRLWAGMAQVPPDARDYVVLFGDDHGSPRLRADHLQAQTGGGSDRPDAFDWYGTWKWFDLLLACAFAGEWCDDALGDTRLQRDMGRWSDGRPVVEPEITDYPLPLGVP